MVLRNQHNDLTISKGKRSARVDATRRGPGGAIDKARSHGAQNVHGFDTVNGFAATVTAAQQSAIAADPTVATVYPDLPITKPPRPRAASRSAPQPAAPSQPSARPTRRSRSWSPRHCR